MTADLAAQVARDGFTFVHGDAMRLLLEANGELSDWPAFSESWNDLGLDTYMADGGRYRKRRHATFAIIGGDGIVRQPHQPHYQSRDYNPLNGGIARWFDPVQPEIGSGPVMSTILLTARALFDILTPAPAERHPGAAEERQSWHVEVHQFRITATPGEAGQPTPEGMHRDGVDHVLVLLIARSNIKSGMTAIHAPDGATLGSFTLTHPFDAAIVDDSRVMHGVTAVEPIDPDAPAYRDVLVVTFRKEPPVGASA